MSGYFSRVARQGGARIVGDGPGPRTPAAKTESHLAPIDHEESVMVLPRASSGVPASKAAKPNVDAAVQDQTRGHRMTHRATSAIDAATEISPAKANRLTPPESVVETAHPRTAETPPEKTTEKKFFEKTVEMVEGQTARPAEVCTILLREVQEWITAGQTTPEDVTVDVSDSAAEPPPDTSLPSKREPGVVRIAEARAKPVQEVSTTNFSEQNFELSIGSISVVVEGDERPPALAPAQVAVQPAVRETPRRTSRLSRHYL